MRSNRIGTILMAGGLLLVAAALFLAGYNLWDQDRAEATSAQALEQLQAVAPPPVEPPPADDPAEIVIPDYILDPNMDMPTTQVDGIHYIGVLSIPALGLELPVIDQWSDRLLRLAPCRYLGSAYLDDMIISAHNYRSHFGSLLKLLPGDQVTFTDAVGNLFTYEVTEMETLDGTAIEEMAAGEWDLTLFTCTTGGQSRITIRCERIAPI